ncbi:MAG: prepilin-type N-terminal cleavage/methylation domain-containing protein [Candidatus Omnitrophica bacterium]|nr:prepilin-type N-terminal cleavage/methylation domain-containing protein [Candidatus Omnitrophota bacterium]
MGKRGFTLIELIVVIAIIAVLAAIIAPNAFKAIEKAKISATIADLQAIKTGAMSCYSDTGTWMPSCASTAACAASLFIVNSTTPTAGWDGPYLEKWPPQSKWAGAYTYTNASGAVFCTACANAGERYTVISNVPTTAQSKIDIQLDGTSSGTAGSVRYTGTTVNSLISRDGTTN